MYTVFAQIARFFSPATQAAEEGVAQQLMESADLRAGHSKHEAQELRDAAAWAENVPFNETRDYVKKVLSNTTNYAALISGQPQSLKSRIGMVGPREANAPESNNDLP